MNRILSEHALDVLFRDARTPRAWTARPIPAGLLQRVHELAKMGPTSGNGSPLRVIFCTSEAARQRLAGCAASGNQARIRAAPATAIFAYDLEFHEHLPELSPHIDARAWYAGKPRHIETTARRNATLQAAYYILAARACGLDAGPMSGFDIAKVDTEFLAGTTFRSDLICGLGFGDATALKDRAPRFAFDRVCQVI